MGDIWTRHPPRRSRKATGGLPHAAASGPRPWPSRSSPSPELATGSPAAGEDGDGGAFFSATTHLKCRGGPTRRGWCGPGRRGRLRHRRRWIRHPWC
jgi:hypothetical protein